MEKRVFAGLFVGFIFGLCLGVLLVPKKDRFQLLPAPGQTGVIYKLETGTGKMWMIVADQQILMK